MPITEQTIYLPKSKRTISYELERKSVKNINLRIRPDGTIHISIPLHTTQAQVKNVLIEREDWILRSMQRVADHVTHHPELPTLATADTLPYLGGRLSVRYTTCPGKRGRWKLDEPGGVLHIEIPDATSSGWRLSALQTFEKRRTQELVQEYLRQYLPLFAERGVRAPAAVHYKVMKSRWGSCASRTHSLSFNARLCEHPRAFIEYVVVHELCHFLHANHSDAFWREVARYLPDWKTRRALARE